jgi:beta-glucanase (GH16 family)
MKLNILILMGCVCLSGCGPWQGLDLRPKNHAIPEGYTLVWADEFNDDGLPDPANWSYDTGGNREGWHNNEKQYYAQARLANSRVAGGVLHITARKEDLSAFADFGGQAYSSARLLSRAKREFTYGFFDIRAKMPCGQGTWPAIWMLGHDGDWPHMGETDILEHVGAHPGVVQSALHMGAHFGGAAMVEKTPMPDACGTFHNYQVLWTPQSMTFYVDGVAYHRYDNDGKNDPATWPYRQPQFFILNLAIGGDLGGAVDDRIFPRSLKIDYVRAYQKP